MTLFFVSLISSYMTQGVFTNAASVAAAAAVVVVVVAVSMAEREERSCILLRAPRPPALSASLSHSLSICSGCTDAL